MTFSDINDEIVRLKKTFIMIVASPNSINQCRIKLGLGRKEFEDLSFFTFEGAAPEYSAREELENLGVDIVPVDLPSFFQAFWSV